MTGADRSADAADRARGSGRGSSSHDVHGVGRRLRVAGYAGFLLLAYLPVLLTDRGRVDSDTKSYLYLDPGRFLSGAASMWDPRVGMGTVSHQTIGYLFPMGPFYWVLEQVVGLPAWVAERIWLGTLVAAAGLGVAYLLRVIGVRGVGVGVAVLAYAFTPYVLQFSARLSVLLSPWSGLPWLIAFVILGLRHGGWRYPALFAITVQLVGGINASALLFVAIGPALVIPYVVWVLRDVSPRRAWTLTWRTGALTLVTSLWWMSGLWVQGRYGLNILRFSESVQAVSGTLLASELVRGLGYWFFYSRDRSGLATAAVTEFTQRTVLIFVSFLIPALAMLGAAIVRWRYRAYFALLVVIGVALAAGASPYSDPPLLGSLFKSFAHSSSAGFALRSTARAVPLIALGLAVLLGSAISALVSRARTQTHRRAAWGVAVLVALLCVANSPGVWNGRYYSPYLERPESVPQYWQRSLSDLNAKAHTTRVMAVPGIDFAAYTWGETVDPIEPGLMDRPYVARELVPWGSDPSANLLIAVDSEIQNGAPDPAALAPVMRLMSVGDVLVRADLQTQRFGLLSPQRLWQEFRTPPAGMGPPRPYGVQTVGEETFPAVATVPITGTLPITRVKSTARPIVVDGDGVGLVETAAAGLLDANRPVLSSAAYERRPGTLRSLVTPGAALVVTDTNRRRAQQWSSMTNNYGFTEQAGEQPLVENPGDQRLDPFPGSTDRSRTVTVLDGGVSSVEATVYGTQTYGYAPAVRPSQAVDGNLNTAWEFGGDLARTSPETIEVKLRSPITTDHVKLVQTHAGTRTRWIRRITISLDHGTTIHRTLTSASHHDHGQSVSLGGRHTFSAFKIRVDTTVDSHRVASSGRSTPVGFAEIGLRTDRPGARAAVARETTRVPVDLLSALGTGSAGHPLAFVMARDGDDLRRQLSLPTRRQFAVSATGRLSNNATDDTIDRLLGLPGADRGGVTATSSGHLPFAATRARAAIDGDPGTAWSVVTTDHDHPWIRIATPSVEALDHLDLRVVNDGLHSVATSLEVASDSGESRVVDLPELADQATPNASTLVPVRFPRMHGKEWTITVRRVRAVYLPGDTGGLVTAPTALAELGLPGIRPAGMPSTLPDSCSNALLTADGKPVAARIIGSPSALLGHGPIEVRACDPLALGAGTHRIAAIDPHTSGVVLNRMLLTSGADGAAVPAARFLPGPGSTPPAPRIQVHDDSRTEVTARVAGATTPFWLVLGESHNPGWTARIGNHDLGSPQLIDGYANGWLVHPTAGNPNFTVRMVWTPQATVTRATLVSTGAVIACFGLVIGSSLGRRRRRLAATRSTDDPPTIGTTGSGRGVLTSGAVIAAAGYGAFVGAAVRPWVGLVVGVLVLVACVRHRWRALLRFAPPVILVAIALVVSVGQLVHRYPAGGGWAGAFEVARMPAWIAVALLGADGVVGMVVRRAARRPSPSPQSADAVGRTDDSGVSQPPA